MLQYIIQTIAFQTFFLLVFDVFLRKETFFNWNRLYLIATAIISIVLPFIKVESFKNVLPEQYIIRLPEVFIGDNVPKNSPQITFETITVKAQPLFSWELLLYVGMFLAALLFVFKVAKIGWLLYKTPKNKLDRFLIVKLINSSTAFSFFNYIFLGERLSEHERESILQHEMVHVKQKHTLDLLFFEVLRIVFWFNPLVYMYQNRLMTVHEFIADEKAVITQDKTNYYQSLLSQVFETKNMSFINPFFKQSLIKKRIVMLQKSKSKQINLFKYALLIPMIFGMLLYTSSNAQEKNLEVVKEVTEIQKLEKSPLIEKIKAIKSQIEVQGNTSDEEDNGLKLLLKVAKQDALDPKLIEDVQVFMEMEPKTALIFKISDVFEQIQIQGTMTDQEDKGLKNLLLLTSDDGFNDPFLAVALEDVEVPFAVIEQVPLFPGCESLSTNEEQKDCMSKEISMYVNKNFNASIGKENGLKGKQLINVIFKINSEGNISDVRSRAAHPVLEAEAVRVIKSLPKMIPGTHEGKAVTVLYSLPIIFQVADDEPKEYKN